MAHQISAALHMVKGRGDEGQGMVEYSMMLLFVAIACVVSVTAFGAAVLQLYQNVVDAWPGL